MLFCQALLKEQQLTGGLFLKKLLITDETYVHAGDGTRKAWQSDEDVVYRSRVHHPTKVMLWGGIDIQGNILWHWCNNFTEFYAHEATRSLYPGESREIPPPGRKLGNYYYRKEILMKQWIPYHASHHASFSSSLTMHHFSG